MQYINRLFFAFFTGICSVAFVVPNAFGLAANSCSTGGEYQYCGLWRSCKKCPSNCYCPKRDNPNTESCTGWTGLKCEAGALKSNTNATQSQGSYGVYACPSDFPLAPEGAKSAEDCYLQCNPPGGQQKLNYKKIHCAPGEMLNFRQMQCVKCAGSGGKAHLSDANTFCPGGDFYPSCSKNQGTQKCDGGKVPNADRSACIVKEEPKKETKKEEPAKAPEKPTPSSVKCDAGKFLPAGDDTSCFDCRSGYACAGGTFTSGSKDDQGIVQCTGNTEPNPSKSACIEKKPEKIYKTCAAGQYLPSNFDECIDCQDGHACAGGTFEVKSGDQGIKKCDLVRGKVSDDKSMCITTAVDCKKGEYLPANEVKCKACEGINKYCPGNKVYDVSDEDQGIYSCPTNASVNSSKSGCKITLTKDVMHYGPGYRTSNYRQQCWFMVSIEDYKQCVMGRTESNTKSDSNAKTDCLPKVVSCIESICEFEGIDKKECMTKVNSFKHLCKLEIQKCIDNNMSEEDVVSYVTAKLSAVKVD